MYLYVTVQSFAMIAVLWENVVQVCMISMILCGDNKISKLHVSLLFVCMSTCNFHECMYPKDNCRSIFSHLEGWKRNIV